MRKLRLALLIVVAIAAVLFTLSSIGTTYESYDQSKTSVDAQPPAWAAPCARTNATGPYFLPCAHLVGRILYVQRNDPDGDANVHFLVAIPGHLALVKYERGSSAPDSPGVGDLIEVSGLLVDGRWGLPEVLAAPIA